MDAKTLIWINLQKSALLIKIMISMMSLMVRTSLILAGTSQSLFWCLIINYHEVYPSCAFEYSAIYYTSSPKSLNFITESNPANKSKANSIIFESKSVQERVDLHATTCNLIQNIIGGSVIYRFSHQ